MPDIIKDDLQALQRDGRLRQAQLKMAAMLQIIDKICERHQIDYWLEGGTLLGAIRHQGFIPWDDDMDISMPRKSFERFLKIAPAEMPDYMWLQTPKTDPEYFSLCVPLRVRDKNSRCIMMHESGDEPYQQGLFIDIFVYDAIPENKLLCKLRKIKANKIQRLLTWKYSKHYFGHYAKLYRQLSKLFSKDFLENTLNKLIINAKNSHSPYMGYGYDCVNRNIVQYEDIYPLKRTLFEGYEFKIAQRPEVILEQLYGDYMTLPPEDEQVMAHCKKLIPILADADLSTTK